MKLCRIYTGFKIFSKDEKQSKAKLILLPSPPLLPSIPFPSLSPLSHALLCSPSCQYGSLQEQNRTEETGSYKTVLD